MKKFVIMPILLLLLFISNADSENYYVSPSGSGNKSGSDWNNIAVFSTLAFTRGNTYYLADGSYASKVISTEESGSTFIYIKKATATDHGTETGWVAGYGDEQAIFTPSLHLNRGYIEIDGGRGTPSDPSTYGIKITPASCASNWEAGMGIPITNATVVKNVTLRHIAFVGCGVGSDIYMVSLQVGRKLDGWTYHPENFLIDNNYFNGNTVNIETTGMQYSTISNNYFAENWSSIANHGAQISLDGASNHNIIKNNIFKNTSVYVVDVHGPDQGGTVDNTHIFNNIVNGCYPGQNMTAIFGTGDSGVPNNIYRMYVYNNTITNLNCRWAYAAVFPGTLTDNGDGSKNSVARNNIFYNVKGEAGGEMGANVTYSHNAFYDTPIYNAQTGLVTGTGSPFVDIASGNYRLKVGVAAINAGVEVGSKYNVDFTGTSRPQGYAWDIGAFESNIAKTPKSPTIIKVE